jgi:hypothetical protein
MRADMLSPLARNQDPVLDRAERAETTQEGTTTERHEQLLTGAKLCGRSGRVHRQDRFSRGDARSRAVFHYSGAPHRLCLRREMLSLGGKCARIPSYPGRRANLHRRL